MNVAVAVVESTEHNGGKADRPDPIIDFFEADLFAHQRFRQKDGRIAPRNLAHGRDATDFEMTGILEWRQAPRQPTRRRLIPAGWHVIGQRVVRSLMVVFDTEAITAGIFWRF
jgi:hypothetical protein